MAWDVMSGVTKTARDVLSGVANLCGMFRPECQKLAWYVLSLDVLSSSHFFQVNHQSVKQFGPRSGSHCVGPDLGPNCLQRLSADDTQ